MSKSALRHWPLAVPAAVWALLFAGLLNSEVLRAVLAVTCMALMVYQLWKYRSSTSGPQLAYLSLIVMGFFLASVWLALNVIRYYTYDGGTGRVYSAVVSSQDVLVWVIAALLIAVAVWSVFILARWCAIKCRLVPSRSN